MARQPTYKYLMPIRGNNPYDINQKFMGTPNVKHLQACSNDALAGRRLIRPRITIYKVFSNGDKVSFPMQKIPASKGKNSPKAWDQQTMLGGEEGKEASILEFDWKREGQTSAEWKSNIAASLKLFVANPKDLDREQPRTAKNGKTYKLKYLDLLYRPKPTKKDPKGNSIPNPDYFRIQVTIDYIWKWKKKYLRPSMFKMTQTEVDNLKKFYKSLSTTMYLSVHDHDIEFGSTAKKYPPMIINARYIGYVSNVLGESGVFQKTDDNTVNPYGGVELKKYSNIIWDMVERGKVYVSDIGVRKKTEPFVTKSGEEEDRDVFTFELTGKPKEADSTEKEAKAASDNIKSTTEGDVADADEIIEKLKDLRVSSSDFKLKWFYFGDLIDTVLASAYKDPNHPHADALKNDIRFLIGPIIIRDKNDTRYSINICDLPVPLETFIVWFSEKIINQKRKKYIVSSFLRNAFNSLIRGIYGPKTRTDPEFKSPALSFTTFSLPLKNNEDQIFLDKKPGDDIKHRQILDIGDISHDANQGTDPFINYYLIYSSHESRFSFYSTMNEDDDSKKGIPHIKGVKRGAFNQIKFKKTDTPGMGAANIIRSGRGQGVLRGIYNADLDLLGCPIFNPGMVIFISPSGLMLGDVTAPNSLSRQLGMGGYYAIRSVSYAWDGKALTGKVDASWISFGNIGTNQPVLQFGVAGSPQGTRQYGTQKRAAPTMETKEKMN
jgi:hypothetical protein